jgi:outer membrane protein assembly factor BamB
MEATSLLSQFLEYFPHVFLIYLTSKELCHSFCVTSQGVLLVASYGRMWGFDPETGVCKWTLSLKDFGSGFMSTCDFPVMKCAAVSLNKRLLRVDPNDGTVEVAEERPNLLSTRAPAAILSVKNLVIRAFNGTITALDEDFQFVWETSVKGIRNDTNQCLCVYNEKYVLVGCSGMVACLSIQHKGVIEWKTSLPGCGYNISTLHLFHNTLIAISGGIMYGMDPDSGTILWKDNLTGMRFSPAVMASYSSSTTNFNALTIPQYVDAEEQYGITNV